MQDGCARNGHGLDSIVTTGPLQRTAWPKWRRSAQPRLGNVQKAGLQAKASGRRSHLFIVNARLLPKELST